MAEPGPRNLITDVPGLQVGQAEDAAAATGTTVLFCEAPAVASVDVRGGAPGSRETELLGQATLVERVDAIVLSGGSAFGLDAAAGVMDGPPAGGRGVGGGGGGPGRGGRGRRVAGRAGALFFRFCFPGAAALERQAAPSRARPARARTV